MKMRRLHRVPLSKQALEIIHDLQAISRGGRWLFPSVRTISRPMSENTLNAAFRRLGCSKDQMTAHGFKSMASTRLNEMGCWNPDAIERQLAHQESDDGALTCTQPNTGPSARQDDAGLGRLSR
jgi:integrase